MAAYVDSRKEQNTETTHLRPLGIRHRRGQSVVGIWVILGPASRAFQTGRPESEAQFLGGGGECFSAITVAGLGVCANEEGRASGEGQ